MSDGQLTAKRLEPTLVDDLVDEPEVLVDHDVLAVADRDPGRLLTAVLLGEEPEVREPAYVVSRRPDAEQTALILR
jgi:hypothetical protein